LSEFADPTITLERRKLDQEDRRLDLAATKETKRDKSHTSNKMFFGGCAVAVGGVGVAVAAPIAVRCAVAVGGVGVAVAAPIAVPVAIACAVSGGASALIGAIVHINTAPGK